MSNLERRNNRTRGVIRCHQTLKRIDGADDSETLDSCAIADLLADIRHLCDAEGIDFHRSSDLSYQHYAAEKQNPWEGGIDDDEDDDLPPAKEYRVEWSIDVYAVDARSAARMAFAIMQEPGTDATVFQVLEHDSMGDSETIDLSEAVE